MTIPPELEARILRYYHVEKWRAGTIARQLHVHHGTGAGAGRPAEIGPPARRSRIEPYLAFIHETLENYPTLTAIWRHGSAWYRASIRLAARPDSVGSRKWAISICASC